MHQPVENLEKPRRFYKTATVEPVAVGFEVRLDGRAPKSPGGRRLEAPTEALAEAIAAEWRAQGEHIDLATMPLTRLAYTALDGVAGAREATAETIASYAGSDLVCYFAEAPVALVSRQEAAWSPMLEWADTELGVALVRVEGVMHRAQPSQSLQRARALALEADDFALAGLAFGAALFGSTVLALAVARGRLTGEDAFALSRLDEAFQEEQWGLDEEAAQRTAAMAREADMLERWFRALGAG
ncbi:ATP12 family chaperone protein [Caulobacter sp. KR2-114]|uniref:ATP12 family chaperone protein n=1 Tax=Caulobacter sp. KR2-114 TaxID=3400912 RepID=UPI003C0470D8